MTVRELIEALKQCDQTLKVAAWNEGDNNEFDVHVVTKSRNEVLLASSAAEVSVSETIIHNDNTEEQV